MADNTMTTISRDFLSTPGISQNAYRRSDQRGCIWFKFAMDFILMGAMCSIGLVGNGLVALIMWKDRQSSQFAFLIVVLSITECCLLVAMFNQKAIPGIAQFTRGMSYYTKYVYPYLITYGWSVSWMLHLTKTWLVVLITAHRYVTICMPSMSKFRSMRSTRIAIGVVMATCVVCSLPRFIDRYVDMDPETGAPRRVLPDFATDFNYIYGYKVVFNYLVVHGIPLVLLAYCNTRLAWSIRQANKRRQEMTNASRAKLDKTLSLVIIVVVFMVCQIMDPIRNFLSARIPEDKQGCGYGFYYFRSLNSIFVVLSSISLLPIFVLCGKGFREKLMLLLFKRTQIRPVSDTSTSGTGSGTAGVVTLTTSR